MQIVWHALKIICLTSGGGHVGVMSLSTYKKVTYEEFTKLRDEIKTYLKEKGFEEVEITFTEG